LRMRNRPSPEQHGKLDLVARLEKAFGLAALGLEIVLTDLRLDTHLLDLRDVLVLPRFPLLATLLVAVLAIIHEATHRRIRVCAHLNEIKALFTGDHQRFTSWHNSDLLPLVVN